VDHHDGEVPEDMDLLVTLPGVGRKTASVVLAEAFGRSEIAVDTHVKRVALRIGLTAETDPTKVERDLKAVVPKPHWNKLSMRMIQFGRDVCDARSPRCRSCALRRTCRYPEKTK
jgi:endonuclease-3